VAIRNLGEIVSEYGRNGRMEVFVTHGVSVELRECKCELASSPTASEASK
jgi:hypothetical protein